MNESNQFAEISKKIGFWSCFVGILLNGLLLFISFQQNSVALAKLVILNIALLSFGLLAYSRSK